MPESQVKVMVEQEGAEDVQQQMEEIEDTEGGVLDSATGGEIGEEEGGLMDSVTGAGMGGGAGGMMGQLSSMSALMTGILGGVLAIAGLLLGMEPIQKVLKGIMNIFQAFLVPFLSMAMKFLGPVMVGLLKLLDLWLSFWQDPKGNLKGILSGLAPWTDQSLDIGGEGGLLQGIWNWIKQITVGDIISHIFPGSLTVAKIIGSLFPESIGVNDYLKKFEDVTVGDIMGIFPSIDSITNFIDSLFPDLGTATSFLGILFPQIAGANWLVNQIFPVMNDIQTFLGNLFDFNISAQDILDFIFGGEEGSTTGPGTSNNDIFGIGPFTGGTTTGTNQNTEGMIDQFINALETMNIGNEITITGGLTDIDTVEELLREQKRQQNTG